MAVDIQVVWPQESIRLNNIRFVVVGGYRALRLSGEDFRYIDEVVIDDIPSPDVIVLSQHELIAQLPDALQQVPAVASVAVLSRRFTFSPRSLIRFRFGNRPGSSKGILRLVQRFVKVLLQTPGSDIFRPGSGGGILSQVGATLGVDGGRQLSTDFVIATTRASRQLIAEQGRDQRAPRDERLLSATVTGTQFDREQGAMYVSIEVVSQTGVGAQANLEV